MHASDPELEFFEPTPEPLWTVAYVSRPTVPFSETELRQLHLAAETWNARHDLTGRLVVVEKDGEPVRFVQCVEGPLSDLEACWTRITGDGRHGDIEVIRRSEIEARRFAKWSMQFEMAREEVVGTDHALALWGAEAARQRE